MLINYISNAFAGVCFMNEAVFVDKYNAWLKLLAFCV